MNKRLIQVLIATVVIALGLFLFMKNINQPVKTPVSDYTNKVHSELYANTQEVWDGQVTVKPFRSQTIGDQEIGSATGLRIEWQAPEQTFNHFLLTITEQESGIIKMESREHEGTSLDITDLKPDTKYIFNLQACIDPKCETWYVAEQEASGRTSKYFFQTIKEQFDPNAKSSSLLETADDEFIPQVIVFLNEDGTKLSDEEKNQLTVGAVYIDKNRNELIAQISQDKMFSYAKLLNP